MNEPAGVTRAKLGGLVVAGTGFLLTRFTVLESTRAAGDDPLAFLVAEAPVLVVGLALTALGVGLAVSTYSKAAVNAVATWTLLGTVAMGAVVASAFPPLGPGIDLELASRVLVGGAAGGALIGVHSARSRRQRRELAHHGDRLLTLNRLLRHEVLNKLNVIDGWAALGVDGETDERGYRTIRRNAEAIDDAMEEVETLTGATGDASLGPVPLVRRLDAELDAIRGRHPEATVRLDGTAADAPERRADGGVRVAGSGPPADVVADEGIALVLRHLLDNAVVHNEEPNPTVRAGIATDAESVRLRIADDGSGLDADQRAVLRDRALPEYDDPTVGFGLTVVRLLLDRYDAAVDFGPGIDGEGTTVEVAFRRADGERTPGREFGLSPASLRAVTVASLVAGVGMGVVLQSLTGTIAVIGALYGVPGMTVGWTLHLFHSVVFGVVYAALGRWSRLGSAVSRPTSGVVAGSGLGVALWLVAAGVVMPLWLRAAGVPAAFPSLQLPSLAGHAVWGALLGGLYPLLVERLPTGERLLPGSVRGRIADARSGLGLGTGPR